jgi:hypothetical protein
MGPAAASSEHRPKRQYPIHENDRCYPDEAQPRGPAFLRAQRKRHRPEKACEEKRTL